MIDDVDDVVSYAMLYDSTDKLCRGSLGLSIIKKISLIREETKDHARGYLKTMGEGINLAFHVRLVIKRVVVKVIKLRYVLF